MSVLLLSQAYTSLKDKRQAVKVEYALMDLLIMALGVSGPVSALR